MGGDFSWAGKVFSFILIASTEIIFNVFKAIRDVVEDVMFNDIGDEVDDIFHTEV